MTAKEMLSAGIVAAGLLTVEGTEVSTARQPEPDGDNHPPNGSGLDGLMPVPFISSTKSPGPANPPYYWSNYPEKSGEEQGMLFNHGKLLWATPQAVSGELVLGFNHVNKTGVPTHLKLLCEGASASVSFNEYLVMGGSTNNANKYGRYISDKHPLSITPPPAVVNCGFLSWGITPLSWNNINGAAQFGPIAQDEMISGRIKMTVNGFARLGLCMLDPGSSFPGTGEAPPSQIMRSRRRGKVAATSQTLNLSKTDFDFGNPNVPFDQKGGYWTSFCGKGSPAGFPWTVTPNETWIGITKWEMPQGDDELWGDYMVRTSIGPITIRNSTPAFPVEVFLVMVPLDDVGAGWNGLFKSHVALWQSQITWVDSVGHTMHTLVKAELNNSVSSGTSENPPQGRDFAKIRRWVLNSANPSVQWSLDYEIPNGSGGWFAFVLAGRGISIAPNEEPG